MTCATSFTSLRVSAEEARYWSRRPRSRDAFFAITSLMKMVDEAPDDVWDLLALTRLGRLSLLDEYVEEFAKHAATQPGLAELEIILDTELGEVRTEVAAVMGLGYFGSAAARRWFEDLMRVPGRVFVLARILAEYPAAEYDVSRGFVRQRALPVVLMHLNKLRQWKGLDPSWRTLFRGSRLLTINLISQRYQYYKFEKGAVTTDTEEMGTWVLDQVAPIGGAREPATPAGPIPAHWRAFHAKLFDAVDSPPHRQKRVSGGVGEGDTLLANTISGTITDLLELQLSKYDNASVGPAARLTAAALVASFAEGMFQAEGGARALGFLFNAMGISFTRGSELKRAFAGHVQRTLGDSLREYFPLGGRSSREDDATEVTEPVHETEPLVVVPVMEVSGPSATDADESIEPRHPDDDLPRFGGVKADVVYHVHFRRPHAKFTGNQKVRFTEKAIEQLTEHVEVEADVWLEALRRGIARASNESGVKLLVFGIKRNRCLPAQIKTRFSNYGVTGEFCDGVWTFTGLTKRH